jgi:dinuclear metal center YbgI/SA1388 family protein
MMKLKEITAALEDFAPLHLQESYDNPGLLIGDRNREITGILCTHDCTEEAIQQALDLKANMIVCHHPLIFRPLRSITGSSAVERLVEKLIQHQIALYATHTSLDNCLHGGNSRTAEKLGLKNLRTLRGKSEGLFKLATFCPHDHTTAVLDALFEAGAGHIGDYDECSFKVTGQGSYRPLEGSDPFVGEQGKRHHEKEDKIEVIVEQHRRSRVLQALFLAHPYEEVAYDLVALENRNEKRGSGVIGEFDEAMDSDDFLKLISEVLDQKHLQFNRKAKSIQKVAICGGSGDFLTGDAHAAGADAFVTGEVSYHRFLDMDGELFIIDAGHYESEQFVAAVLRDHLSEIFPTFAVHLAKPSSPINHL